MSKRRSERGLATGKKARLHPIPYRESLHVVERLRDVLSCYPSGPAMSSL